MLPGSRAAKGFGCAVALSVSLVVSSALAQTDEERAGARAAATAGAQAFAEKRWTDALDLFTRAESLVHAPPHLLYMARANANLGKLVRARELYLKLQRETLAATAPQAFRDAVRDAGTELAAIEPRIPYVTVNVEGAGSEPVVVTQDGSQVSAALIGVPRPVDPGEHEYKATSGGLASEVSKVKVDEGKRVSVVLKLAAGGAAPPGPGTPPGGGDAPPPGGETKGPGEGGEGAGVKVGTDTPPSNDGLRYASYGAFGVGALGLVAGTIFVLQSSSKRSEADDLTAKTCPNGCSAEAGKPIADLDDQARSAQTLGIVGYAVGAVGIGAGITLFILSNKKSDAPATSLTPVRPRITPYIGYGSAGVFGTF
jgi:hypothetical protein